MKPTRDTLALLLLLLMFLGVILMTILLNEKPNFWSLVSEVNTEPYLVAQYKVGDDTKPNVHQLWCVDYAFSKSPVDNSPFCYVQVIDDWIWEGAE